MAEEVTKELTGKQRRFIEAYLGPAMGNATRAAEIAGYSSTSKNSLGAQGSENLRIPKIAAAISERVSELAMSPGEVLAGLAEIARGDMGDFLDSKVYGKPTIVLKKNVFVKDPDTGEVQTVEVEANTRLIKKFVIKEGNTDEVGIELHDRVGALEKLGKYHGLWVEKPEQVVGNQAVVIFMPQNGREQPGAGPGQGQGADAGDAGDQATGRPTA